MKTYPKIDTLYDRNDQFKVDTNKFRRVEFACINIWLVTEKVDGTNVRLHFEKGEIPDFAGRTDRAVFTNEQDDFLADTCVEIEGAVQSVIAHHGLESLTVFGELYGPKIQKGGGRYGKELGFRTFDMMINDRIWLAHESVESNAETFGIELVPNLGVMFTEEIVEMCRNGFVSTFAEDRTYISEGIVAKPAVPLYDNRGERVMWKLKTKDF